MVKFVCAVVVMIGCGLSALALTPPAPKELQVAAAKKLQVTHSMIGFRNTLLFYTFADAGIVVRLAVDTGKDNLPVTATAYVFEPGVGADGLGKWLNNQHSDGLFPEVPEPKETIKLADSTASVVKKTLVGDRMNEFNRTTYKEYDVEIAVKAVEQPGKFQIEGFKDQAKVYLQVKK